MEIIPLHSLLMLVAGVLMVIAGMTGHVWEGIDDKPLARSWKRIFLVIGTLLIFAGSVSFYLATTTN